jgi:hypothetical protein
LLQGDYVPLVLGCNWLSGLAHCRHDDIVEMLRVFIGHPGFSSSCEGWYSRRVPRTRNRPQARWDFHFDLRPGPGQVVAHVSSIHPSQLRTFAPRLAPLATMPLCELLKSAATTTQTICAPDMRSARHPLKH